MIETYAMYAFIAILLLLLFWKWKRFEVKGLFPFIYFALYKTTWGIRLMDRIAKFRLRWFFSLGVIVCFLGMIVICYVLVENTIALFSKPDSVAGILPVLPIEAKGVFYVPFFYWIISIFVIAVVHEFCHGIASRIEGVKVKSSGFAFLGILAPIVPAAFVEPDEKALMKKDAWAKLRVFAAGPFANLVCVVIVLILAVMLAPVLDRVVDPAGMGVFSVVNDSPSSAVGIEKGDVFLEIDGRLVLDSDDFNNVTSSLIPGQNILVKTNRTSHSLFLGNHSGKAYFGVSLMQQYNSKSMFSDFVIWLMGLFKWLVMLNLGVGLFNLVPIGPLDGGRMLQVVFRKKVRAWHFISLFFFIIVMANLITGFLK